MRGDGSRQVRERVELLELTGPHNCQQTFDGAFTVFASCPEDDFAPLNRRAEGSFGSVAFTASFSYALARTEPTAK